MPSLAECATQGETIEELKENLREAITGCLAVSLGERVDAPRTAIDEGDVFPRVRETLSLPEKPR